MSTGRRPNRRLLSVFLTLVLVFTVVVSASAASTTKKLSTNFTLVNLEAGSNSGTIDYFKNDGSAWKTPGDTFSFTTQGEQAIFRQYEDSALPPGDGSVVVSASGKVGAVVQIQARDGQTPTSGAYSGATSGAAQVRIPLVIKDLASASGTVNSQIVVQNTTGSAVTVEIDVIKPDGTVQTTKNAGSVAKGASYEYDLSDDGNVPSGFFGSAVARATNTGGQIAAISNLFSGANGMQVFNGFTSTASQWLVPLFTSRLANGLSTPIAVQNASGGTIGVGQIVVTCKKDVNSPGAATITLNNTTAVLNTAAYFFNPVTDTTNIPAQWFGSCTVSSGGAETVVFVQMRTVGTDQAAAYEGIPATGTAKTVVVPLYAKRLGNGFATAVTIQNLNPGAVANVSLAYKGASGLPANCTTTFNAQIPAGGSLIQNHRTTGGVPQLGEACFGTLTVTSTDQPIDAFVQLTDYFGLSGDTFQAHNAFAIN